jgi:hypothetical protein
VNPWLISVQKSRLKLWALGGKKDLRSAFVYDEDAAGGLFRKTF